MPDGQTLADWTEQQILEMYAHSVMPLLLPHVSPNSHHQAQVLIEGAKVETEENDA